MAMFNIRTVNSTFVSETELEELAHAEDALAIGVRGAIAIAAEDIAQGSASASIVVTVNDAESRPVLQAAVAVSVAPLFLGGPTI